MNLKEENEELREILRRVYNYVPIPDQIRIDSVLSEQDGNEVASPAQDEREAVAYLDLGIGGYMDLGTDLTDEQLEGLPWGRHMLGIIRTYGADGYVPAAPIAQTEQQPEQSGLLEALDWLDTEVSAIDTWYRGSPSYEHGAGWFKDEVLRLIEGRRVGLSKQAEQRTK